MMTEPKIFTTGYDRSKCNIGIVHLGFGAFHRAHMAVYVDDYMDQTGDLDWGIATVNLRAEEAKTFANHAQLNRGYLLKTTTHAGESSFREVRSHVQFSDWSDDAAMAENLLSDPAVKIVSMTVTESGYYLNDDWSLDENDPSIANEVIGDTKTTVYAYLAAALQRRMETINQPITILCCDNIRSNGDVLGRNFRTYLQLNGQAKLAAWLDENTSFPNSMVDRITPRATETLHGEIQALSPDHADTAIHGESFIQWVLENNFATTFPDLTAAGVEVVADVHPYEEAKIRVLNGGHTAMCYLGALAKYQTFDQTMTDPVLRAHFDEFETDNVLPGLTLDLPFSKNDYLDLIAQRFSNIAIADDLERICMDGWSKFPIFVRPTIKSCLAQGISPQAGYDSIASWYVYARRFQNGQTHITYIEPYWDQMKPFLAIGQETAFAQLEALWSDLPTTYAEFVPELCAAIKRMEAQWPI